MKATGPIFTRSARRRLVLLASFLAGACSLVVVLAAVPARAAEEPFGIETFSSALIDAAEAPLTQAGAHPYAMTTTIVFNHATEAGEEGELIRTSADPKSLTVNLPAGLVANPTATPTKCTEAELEDGGDCPAAATVGVASVNLTFSRPGSPAGGPAPLFNMVLPPGEPAEFGFNVEGLGIVVHIFGRVRSGGNYGLSADVSNIIQKLPIYGSQVTLWGNPSDPAHDAQRGKCGYRSPAQQAKERAQFEREVEEGKHPQESEYDFSCPIAPTHTAFLTLPTACPGTPLLSTMSADSWQEPETFLSAEATSPAITGCDLPEFTPTIQATPEAHATDTPSGLHVDLQIPKGGLEEVEGRAEANLKDARVTLPKGLTVNPAAADGLAACSSAEIELHGPEPARCPDASKVGTVEVDTPLLEHPLPGAVYLAAQNDNPFKSLLAIYIAVDDPQTGVVVKLAGQVEPNPATGQLTTTFFENPQLPFEDFKLDFFGGPRAALVTPPTCGSFTTTTDLTPWSAPEGADATPSSSFELTSGPNGSACAATEAAQPNHPGFEAGTTNPAAGAFSPFVLHLKREDGSQPFKALNLTLPPGLSGKLAGVGECSQAQLAQATARSYEGQGALEKQSPSCPASSELGTVNVGAGAGPDPYYVQGHAYLAGPYKGAPLSMAIITPAVAGPFDLGTVVVRAGLYVNPETAQITVRSDPIPQILDGIPLDVRSIAVNVSRNQFTLNPTNCNPMAVTGTAFAQSSEAALSNPFQVGGCAALPFKPKLALKLKGGTKRNQNPALTATLTAKAGEANIARAQVTLPHSEFLDNAHIATVCTRVQFAEGGGNGEQCPAASVYGHAKAISPLLEAPLQGPVYLRSSDNQLPDLVAALNGQISVDLDGKVDTGKGGGIRNTFEVVPDAPVSKFTLSMQGGKKGLLVNSENLCSAKAKTHAAVNLTGQNGKVYDTTPVVANSCAKKKGAKHHKRGGR